MTFLVLFLAAFSGACFHFAFRKSIDGGGRANVFLLLQCFFAFLIVTMINVDKQNFRSCDLSTTLLGLAEGALYVLMMSAMGKAFKKGPPALTVATLNSASIMPGLLMALLFGASFGHGYTLWNGIGSFLVVAGLFMAARTSVSASSLKLWALFAAIAFLSHSLYLTVLQWRALLLKTTEPLPILFVPLSNETAHWFQSMLFLGAVLVQLVLYFSPVRVKQPLLAREGISVAGGRLETEEGSGGTLILPERKGFQKREIFWGIVGGIANGLCTFSLVWAAAIAKDSEKAMIFPISGVTSILLCNLWGKWFYKEKVDWLALALCLTGIVIGTL